MIDGGYLPAGKLLMGAAAQIERLQSILRLIAIHSDDPDISQLAPSNVREGPSAERGAAHG